MPVRESRALTETLFRELVNAGFNTVGRWERATLGEPPDGTGIAPELDQIKEFYQVARSCGLKVIEGVIYDYAEPGNPYLAYASPRYKELITKYQQVFEKEVIPALKDEPNLISYYTLDEPSPEHLPDARRLKVQEKGEDWITVKAGWNPTGNSAWKYMSGTKDLVEIAP